MIAILSYVVIAALILAIALVLGLQSRYDIDADPEAEREIDRGLVHSSGLDLAEQIFDPADYRWLCDELRFPQLARALARHRKELALKWLKGVHGSFSELVRTPQPVGATSGPGDSPSSWAMLFLTLRVHVLLGYAAMVVWMFGPYHRMIPSFGWLRAVSGIKYRKERYRMANVR